MSTQKRSTKIQDAYRQVTIVPVALDQFCEANQVSAATIKQVKRFDKTGMDGRVVIRKDKTLNALVIYRTFPEVVAETSQEDAAVEEILQTITEDTINERSEQTS